MCRFFNPLRRKRIKLRFEIIDKLNCKYIINEKVRCVDDGYIERSKVQCKTIFYLDCGS